MTTQTPSLDATEKVGAAGATAPRITLDWMKSQIYSVHYVLGYRAVNAAERTDWMHGMEGNHSLPPSMATLTICLMVLKSGFILIGKSAPLSNDNFDAEKGRTFAYEDALRQAWPLFAFTSLQVRTGEIGA